MTEKLIEHLSSINGENESLYQVTDNEKTYWVIRKDIKRFDTYESFLGYQKQTKIDCGEWD